MSDLYPPQCDICGLFKLRLKDAIVTQQKNWYYIQLTHRKRNIFRQANSTAKQCLLAKASYIVCTAPICSSLGRYSKYYEYKTFVMLTQIEMYTSKPKKNPIMKPKKTRVPTLTTFD